MNGPGTHGAGGLDLRTTVQLLPTPTARDHEDGRYTPNVETNSLLGREVWALGSAGTPTPSPAGKPSSDDPHPTLSTTAD